MDTEHIPSKELIERSLEATERAVDAIQEGDLARRQTAMELRNLQLSLGEDFERLREMMRALDDQVYQERSENAKWMERRLAKARATADTALSSVLMVADVQVLEKKVEILKDSVVALNRAYYNYEKNVDMQDLMDQVTEMVYRTEQKEKAALAGRATDEKSMENVFRSSIESLYGLKSTNPKVMEEAKKLAAELRVFRDAAANNNFHTMIAAEKPKAESSDDSSEGTVSSQSSKKVSAEKDSTTSSSSYATTTSSSAGTTSSSQMSL